MVIFGWKSSNHSPESIFVFKNDKNVIQKERKRFAFSTLTESALTTPGSRMRLVPGISGFQTLSPPPTARALSSPFKDPRVNDYEYQSFLWTPV